MSRLISRVAKVNRAVTHHLGERFTITPMEHSDFGAATDLTRPGGVLYGSLRFMGDEADLGGSGAKWGARVGVTGAILDVMENAVPNGVTILKDDVITANERGGRRFKVNRVDPKLGMLVIELGDMG